MLPDTLTEAEETAFLRLSQQASRFSNALFEFVVLYIQERPDPTPGFSIADADIARFQEHLAETGIEMETSVLEEARRYIRFQLEREIALRRAGVEGEFLRLIAADPPLARAVELLEEARSQQDLFDLALAEGPGATSTDPALSGVGAGGSSGSGSF